SLDAKRGDRVAGPRPRRAPVDDAVAHEALCARREQRVVGQRELGDGTAALALFGHVGEAMAAPRGDAEMADANAIDRDGVGARRALARERCEELALAVAGNAGDADDLARPHVEVDAGERRAERIAGGQVE